MQLIGMAIVMVRLWITIDCGGGKTVYTIPDEADNGLLHNPCTISMAKTSARTLVEASSS